ncbi:nitrate- and nitrite sensing domain-containing protein [Methylophaga sp. OBS3]|uniref:nitrate- and nitrite sensing domain-containing protein n=1 Tax=Methylophaga sp. OBS3 TaxID=2991934 RepID=UPI0022560CAB|nr:nitrate- and nitrite sensing domain-containing protein [Methylophaga sp. OBS3]
MTLMSISAASALLFGSAVRWQQQQTLQHKKLRQGLYYLSQLQQLIMTSQQHRAISSAFLDGDSSLQPELLTLQRQIDAFISDKANQSLQSFAQWQSFADHWPRLKQAVSNQSLPVSQLLRQHVAMIDTQLKLLDVVCQHYHLYDLMLDNMTRLPDICIDTLHVAEDIAQMRAVGTALCLKEEMSDDIALRLVHRSLSARIRALLKDLHAIQNPQLHVVLNNHLLAMQTELQQLMQLVEKELLDTKQRALPPQSYFNAATRPINAVQDCFNVITQFAVNNYAKLI